MISLPFIYRLLNLSFRDFLTQLSEALSVVVSVCLIYMHLNKLCTVNCGTEGAGCETQMYEGETA